MDKAGHIAVRVVVLEGREILDGREILGNQVVFHWCCMPRTTGLSIERIRFP